MTTELPQGFIEEMRSLLPEEADELFEALQKDAEVSIKLNRRKLSDPSILGYEGLEGVRWCDSGYYLPERPRFTLNPLLHAGAFYVQDASSMIHREVISRLVSHPITLLDLCAAPGGKTTAMIDGLPDGSRVVANEYMPKRAAIL
ncbi:MAG: hypothetical protein K2J87_03875, partial [Muribaculaceae bacterium]|nr:hypothetical protein [Muribaculaceae bacterium]